MLQILIPENAMNGMSVLLMLHTSRELDHSGSEDASSEDASFCFLRISLFQSTADFHFSSLRRTSRTGLSSMCVNHCHGRIHILLAGVDK
jgi:hypothetical protein